MELHALTLMGFINISMYTIETSMLMLDITKLTNGMDLAYHIILYLGLRHQFEI